ncbi:glycine, alanine and asparagine-rich protein-like [Pyrus x bretschneideri]|uniref:glycine, alanine and asparagine-rich protein-like n=1 Tax=Pyrus x bretschneideri TaxID=225117 RepID=UPI00202FB12E|nr:glycine, alanine and asparagine-rich protein-like [Pyrus x bretschneideri]
MESGGGWLIWPWMRIERVDDVYNGINALQHATKVYCNNGGTDNNDVDGGNGGGCVFGGDGGGVGNVSNDSSGNCGCSGSGGEYGCGGGCNGGGGNNGSGNDNGGVRG